MSIEYKYTIHCFDDKSKRKHFKTKKAAVAYANTLLRRGHNVKLFPYQPYSHIDHIAQNEEQYR